MIDADGEAMTLLQRWIWKKSRGQQLGELTDRPHHYASLFRTWRAEIENLNADELAETFEGLPWVAPDRVVLALYPEDGRALVFRPMGWMD